MPKSASNCQTLSQSSVYVYISTYLCESFIPHQRWSHPFNSNIHGIPVLCVELPLVYVARSTKSTSWTISLRDPLSYVVLMIVVEYIDKSFRSVASTFRLTSHHDLRTMLSGWTASHMYSCSVYTYLLRTHDNYDKFRPQDCYQDHTYNMIRRKFQNGK